MSAEDLTQDPVYQEWLEKSCIDVKLNEPEQGDGLARNPFEAVVSKKIWPNGSVSVSSLYIC
jgi:hypothetical protein